MTTNEKVFWVVGILVLVALAVFYDHREQAPSQAPTTTPVTTTTTPPSTVACTVVPSAAVTLYERPSTDASVFGTINVGTDQTVIGITDNGWYAFEPDVAQAGNIGIFRNRYIPASGSFTTTGDCADLTQLPALPANTCFTSAATSVPVYTEADVTTPVVGTMNPGDYLPAISTKGQKSSDYADYFVEVESVAGSTPAGVHGWIQGSDVNFNGASCDTLPGN